MRVLLFSLLLLFSVVSSQMTFSDHWSKKSSFPVRQRMPKEETQFCKEEPYYKEKLEWLRAEIHKTQKILNNCRLPRN